MDYKIITVAGGFYFFGKETESTQEGYITIIEGAMFGSFSGKKGVAGVASGNSASTVILDRFSPTEELVFPVCNVYAILPSINLYQFNGTTIRT